MCAERKTINWQPEHINYIREDYIAGKTGIETVAGLAKNFGFYCTEKAVRGVIYRYCRDSVAERHERIQEQRKAIRLKARELTRSGMTAVDAAKDLGVDVKRIYSWIERNRRLVQRSRFSFKNWLSKQSVDAVPEDPIVDGGLLITELASNQCHWPIGKDHDGLFRFCGCKFTRAGRSPTSGPYCDEHVTLSVRPTAKKVKAGPERSEASHYFVATIFEDNSGDGPVPVTVISADDHKLAA